MFAVVCALCRTVFYREDTKEHSCCCVVQPGTNPDNFHFMHCIPVPQMESTLVRLHWSGTQLVNVVVWLCEFTGLGLYRRILSVHADQHWCLHTSLW